MPLAPACSSLRIRCTPDFENLAVALRIWVDKDLEVKGRSQFRNVGGETVGFQHHWTCIFGMPLKIRRRFVSHSIELQA